MKSAKEILTSTSKFHITLGLDRISAILNLLDNPQNSYKIIHIAGTNGKGSTSKIINELLINHFKGEKKIGLFTSPHIFEYEERIKINNTDISKNIFNHLIFEINELAIHNNIELSEFELITACAFYYFYIKNADYVILETGLGGMFDATNIIENPILTIITTIDFDHTERLGKTIEEISIQKAGILKKNCPVIIDKENLGFSTVEKIANEKNIKVIEPVEIKTYMKNKKNYALVNQKEYEFNLLGSFQAKNLSAALCAIRKIIPQIKDSTIKQSLKNVVWKYRLEYDKKKNLIIDCAHNPNGIKALKTFLDENFKNEEKTFIFGCLKNKDYKKMMEILMKDGNNSKFYFYEYNYPNAQKYDNLEEKYKKIFKKAKNIKEIINEEKNLKIVAGSIYMLSEIFN